MDLTEFLSGGLLPLNILTTESSLYLPRLRELYPNAKLFALTNCEEAVNYKKYRDLGVNWSLNENIKIFDERFFDIIIAESLLTYTKNSYDDLMNISRALKETGYLLSTFKNIRYAPVLNELKEGRFPFRDEKLYAKTEIVKMLNDAVFKEIAFLPMETDLSVKDTAKEFINAGFENFNDDLLTKIWMFKASVSTSSVLALKELYDKETRKNLAKLIRRVEYDIEREKNLENLWNFIEEHAVFPDYLLGFVEEICVYKESVLKILEKSAREKGLTDFSDAINEALQ